MKICPSCKVRYEEDEELCSRCGTNLIEEISEKRKSLQKGKKTNIFLLLSLLVIPVAVRYCRCFRLFKSRTNCLIRPTGLLKRRQAIMRRRLPSNPGIKAAG